MKLVQCDDLLLLRGALESDEEGIICFQLVLDLRFISLGVSFCEMKSRLHLRSETYIERLSQVPEICKL